MGGIGRDWWYGRDMKGLVVWEGYAGTGGMEGIGRDWWYGRDRTGLVVWEG